MLVDQHFLRDIVVDTTAAVVGIGRSRWQAAAENGQSQDQVLDLMRRHRFDILPVEPTAVVDSEVRTFYSTREWGNFTSIERRKINHDDVIRFDTPIRELIKLFADQLRNFFFLSSENKIVGLVTIANLNCRQVNIYLFSLLAELEVLLAKLVSENVENKLLEEYIDADPKLAPRREEDRKVGTDLPAVEYLYLSSLINVMTKEGLHKELGYSSRKAFDRNFGPLVKLRNTVAHPTKSIVSGPDGIKQLWKRINLLEMALQKLDRSDRHN